MRITHLNPPPSYERASISSVNPGMLAQWLEDWQALPPEKQAIIALQINSMAGETLIPSLLMLASELASPGWRSR